MILLSICHSFIHPRMDTTISRTPPATLPPSTHQSCPVNVSQFLFYATVSLPYNCLKRLHENSYPYVWRTESNPQIQSLDPFCGIFHL